MKITIRRFGRFQGVVIPKPLLTKYGLKIGDSIELRLQKGTSVIGRDVGKRYTVAELMPQCDLSAPMPSDLVDWDSA